MDILGQCSSSETRQEMFFGNVANKIKHYSKNVPNMLFGNSEYAELFSYALFLITTVSICTIIYVLCFRSKTDQLETNVPSRSNSGHRCQGVKNTPKRIHDFTKMKVHQVNSPLSFQCVSNVSSDHSENCLVNNHEFSNTTAFVEDTPRIELDSSKSTYQSSRNMIPGQLSQWSVKCVEIRSFQGTPSTEVPTIQPVPSSKSMLIQSTPQTQNIIPCTVNKHLVIPSSSRNQKSSYIISQSSVTSQSINPIMEKTIGVSESSIHCSETRVSSKPSTYRSAIAGSNKPFTHMSATTETLDKIENNSALMDNYYAKLTSDQQMILKAIRNGDLGTLKKFKQHGVAFNFNENNPMREAVLSNKLDVLKFLHYECGVDLNSEYGFAIR